SGKSAGGVGYVLNNAPAVPGLAIVPHAINPTGSTKINVYGSRWKASTSVTIDRNGTSIGTLTSNSSGIIAGTFTLAAQASSQGAVYTAYTTTTGSLVGQSLEERFDAGTSGDANAGRAFVSRAVLNASSGGYTTIVGEGFTSGESVILQSCASANLTADAQ